MQIDKLKLTNSRGYLEGTLEAVDQETAQVASSYKKNICKNFISINPEQIDYRIGGEAFYLTRKMDGEMNVIFFNGDDTFTINTGGKVRMGLSCIEEAGKLLKKAGVKSAIIPAELYVCEDGGRTRVFDVLSALSKETEQSRLCLAPFDALEIDGQAVRTKSYEETYGKLKEIFGRSESLRPVLYKKAASKAEVKEVYHQWVVEENSEGVIVRSELPLVFKVKPKHTIDVAIVGFTEGTGDQRGQVRTLLFALMTEEGEYQILGKTGNGFSEEQKKGVLEMLSGMCIDSEYMETDSNHVAFRMVKPQIVMEISFNDILLENSTARITNPILKLEGDKYKVSTFCNGFSFIYPIFVRMREDKKVDTTDVRLSQVTDLIYVPDFECRQDAKTLPESEVLLREVYKKESGSKLMVQKFLLWKTNKEGVEGQYPAYVLHYTNFSPDRKEPLQRDIRISNSKEQIVALTESFMKENIKKGWVRVE